jgi:quercetin dioxygenase-like cupin family protein
MIFYNNDAKSIQALPGLVRRTLAQSPSMMICEFTFEANIEIPLHAHPHEQVGYLVEGQVEMTIDGEKNILDKGDSYYAPSNVPHGVYTLKPSIIIDTFSPPREDYQ